MYIQRVSIDGKRITDPVPSTNHLSGRLEDILNRLAALLEINIRTRIEVRAHPGQVNRADYPLEALRQVVFDTVMHRQYEGTNFPIVIYWHNDRIAFMSPSGLYGDMTPENSGKADTDCLNPLIGEVMNYLGFVKRFGLEVALTRKVLEEDGNPPPQFSFSGTLTLVAVARASWSAEEGTATPALTLLSVEGLAQR